MNTTDFEDFEIIFEAIVSTGIHCFKGDIPVLRKLAYECYCRRKNEYSSNSSPLQIPKRQPA